MLLWSTRPRELAMSSSARQRSTLDTTLVNSAASGKTTNRSRARTSSCSASACDGSCRARVPMADKTEAIANRRRTVRFSTWRAPYSCIPKCMPSSTAVTSLYPFPVSMTPSGRKVGHMQNQRSQKNGACTLVKSSRLHARRPLPAVSRNVKFETGYTT
eukprot:scaffold3551_cov408-Prasinococcus_capsulatus_cf.AAC.33